MTVRDDHAAKPPAAPPPLPGVRVRRKTFGGLGAVTVRHFKASNAIFGHLAGDLLLKDLVTAVRGELRTGDIIARWGGEEFALALPDCALHRARTIASRLLNVVPSGQAASIGLTQARPQDTPRALIERADTALYAAKNAGRNQVKAHQGPATLGLVHGDGDAAATLRTSK